MKKILIAIATIVVPLQLVTLFMLYRVGGAGIKTTINVVEKESILECKEFVNNLEQSACVANHVCKMGVRMVEKDSFVCWY